MLKHDKDVAAYRRGVLQRPAGGRSRGAVPDGERSRRPSHRPSCPATGSRGSRQIVLGAATMARTAQAPGPDRSRSPTAFRPTRPSTSRRPVCGSWAQPPFPRSGSPARSRTTPPWARACSSRSRCCRRRSWARSTEGPTRRSTVRTSSSSGPDPVCPPAAVRSNLDHIVAAADRAFAAAPGGSAGNAIVVQGVQRPAEIVNYRTIGATPTLLVSALVLGAIAALTLTLVASVRQRRRDLALLKTIGFVRRQLASVVAWQATRGRRRRDRGRHPARDHRRSLAMGPLRSSDLRRAVPHGVRPLRGPCRARHPRRSSTSLRPFRPELRRARRRQPCCGRSRPPTARMASGRLTACGAIATLRSSSAAFSSAERFRRAESADASCSPVGVAPPERIRWSASTAKARPRRLSAQRMHSVRCASSGAAAAARSRPSTASSTCTLTLARRCASSVVRLREHEFPGQLGRGHGRPHRALPVHLAALPPGPGDREGRRGAPPRR